MGEPRAILDRPSRDEHCRRRHPKKSCVDVLAAARSDVARHDINYMVGTPDGVVHFSERHYMGLFRDQDYQEAMDRANLELIHSDPKGFFGNGLYVARLRK